MEEYDDLIPEPGEDGIVDMTHRGWKHLDKVVWLMGPAVLQLNLGFNKLETLPDEIVLLTLLRDLNIEHNALSEIPACFGKLRRLRSVKANNNSIESIPEELGDCHMLEELHFKDNRLKTVPKTLEKCDVLNTLDLTNNKLDILPVEIGGIETLKYLHLSGNDGLKHMLPSYLHEDSKTCVFILKLLNDQRCEVRDLKTRNQELEELAKNKEEYNLRIQDEVQDLQDEFDRQLNIFPRSFVNLQKGFGASCTVS
mmetsp:Transcript_18064/g.37835  ORF Transcript_18064/g.37835 Transcript_18064/m.37835 type:complete len:254 (-) Transcript_18064:286-1047(-)|eukprot:CAMPEP_0182547588 /NCGR_PEP_ID=MMETSP1323-20130603/37648_1 /TAXON_ID=236787 /ORGANISM="Florenciella parvula, Strain RCC1693" /LENGTH=253 /DNA_ID=CAMNT_0024758905 /DNA_START=160 /DNA_END=921 /DNA_ORIENTATION=-